MSSSKIQSQPVLYKCWLQPGGFKSFPACFLPLLTWAHEGVPRCTLSSGNPCVWDNCPAEPRYQTAPNLYAKYSHRINPISSEILVLLKEQCCFQVNVRWPLLSIAVELCGYCSLRYEYSLSLPGFKTSHLCSGWTNLQKCPKADGPCEPVHHCEWRKRCWEGKEMVFYDIALTFWVLPVICSAEQCSEWAKRS